MSPRIAEASTRWAAERVVGRETELAWLDELLGPDPSAFVLQVHGIPGIGKSALLAAFGIDARRKGVVVIDLDCRTIEPTEAGFLAAVGRAIGLQRPTVSSISRRIEREPGGVVLTLDHYEVFRLMDTWMRQVFVPSLPDTARVLFAGREPPVAAWLTTAGVAVHRLGPLTEEGACRLLERLGVGGERAARLNRVLRGHPLAIQLAGTALAEEINLDEVTAQRAIEQLCELYLADIPDRTTRRVLEASSVTRRTTMSLLEAMLPGTLPRDAFQRVHSLPFVDARSDGLIVHDSVHDAIADVFRAADPNRYREYRRAAWRQLRREVRGAAQNELWRYTADMLYLIENPVVREAFFPSGAQPLVVEPARPEDGAAIALIADRHAGRSEADALREWWARAPRAFSVVRDRDGVVAGFLCLLEGRHLMPPLVPDDPVATAWWEHLRRDPVPARGKVLGFRRWLDLEHGEAPGAVQAATWLDVKRTYMELRPDLYRIYTVVHDVRPYAPVIERLGFRPLAGTWDNVPLAPPSDDGRFSVALDFGPDSVDGWLTRLAGAELGLDDVALDAASHEVVLDGRRIALTPLEFGVFDCLHGHAGSAVGRAELLDSVWGFPEDGGSNVVDVVVRRLRTKLGPDRDSIQTVRGAGYRLRVT